MLTVHILTKNNEGTISQCLDSIYDLDSTILVGDYSSTDSTKDICKSRGIHVITVDETRDTARNKLVLKSKTEWQFYIEPWEKMLSGGDELAWAMTQKESAYNIYKVHSDLITKETRLWSKSSERKFINPVFETIDPPAKFQLRCYLTGSDVGPDENELIKWKEGKYKSPEIDYYLACSFLVNKDYNKFLSYASSYLFSTTTVSVSSIMTHYYRAQVYFNQKKYNECMQDLVVCLAEAPCMAEFWCLLGDLFFKLKQWNRASSFYDSAMLFGKNRSENDPYPIQISKYNEYPANMMEICRKLILNQ